MSILFHGRRFDRRSLLLVIVAIIGAIIQVMDKSFGNTFAVYSIFPRSDVLVFGLIILISIIIQSVLIKKARESLMIERSKTRLGQAVLIVAVLLQYISSGILVIILFQATFTLKYSIIFLEAILGINLTTSSVLLAVLSWRFIRSLRYFPSKLVLTYTIAIAFLSLSGIITFIYVENFLQRKPDFISSEYNAWTSFSPRIPPDLAIAYQLIGIISFLTMWIATVFMTNYASKSKKIKYWIIVSIPLVYFLSQFFISYLERSNLLGQLGLEYSPLNEYMYNLALNTIRTAGGLMFGFAFFMLSKTSMHAQLKGSMMMAGIGLILLFGANAASLVILTTFPPWGIVSTTFLITGSYCLLIGLDSAGFYIATDSSLRRIIQKSPQKGYDILKSLGHAELQDIVADKIQNISKQVYHEIEFESLFRIHSEPANVQQYVDNLIRELGLALRQKAKRNNHHN
jgi:uncharacterized membrane protein YwzB